MSHLPVIGCDFITDFDFPLRKEPHEGFALCIRAVTKIAVGSLELVGFVNVEDVAYVNMMSHRNAKTERQHKTWQRVACYLLERATISALSS